MHLDYKPSFTIIILIVILFCSERVLYAPALPFMAEYFHISNGLAGQTIGIFLLGYAVGN